MAAGDFHSLRLYATKEALFKQDVSSKAYRQGKVLSSEFFDRFAGASCASLVFEWLTDKILVGKNIAFKPRSSFAPGGSAAQRKKEFLDNNANIIGNNAIKTVNYRKDSSKKADANLANEHSLILAEKSFPNGPNLDGVLELSFRDNPAHQGVYISLELNFTGKNGGFALNHAVGYCRIPSGNYFFDPNIGIYRVTDHDKFFAKYKELFASVFELDIIYAQVSPVQIKPKEAKVEWW